MLDVLLFLINKLYITIYLFLLFLYLNFTR